MVPIGEKWGERAGHPRPGQAQGDAGQRAGRPAGRTSSRLRNVGFGDEPQLGGWGGRGWGGLIPRSRSSSGLPGCVTLSQDLDLSGPCLFPWELGQCLLPNPPGLWMRQAWCVLTLTSLPPSSPGRGGGEVLAHPGERSGLAARERPQPQAGKDVGRQCARVEGQGHASRPSSGETEAKTLWVVRSSKGPRCPGTLIVDPPGVVTMTWAGDQRPGSQVDTAQVTLPFWP